MKHEPTPSLQARLSKVALTLESGAGEASLLFEAAEHINRLELSLQRAQQSALYLRSTMADVAALLAGEQIEPGRIVAEPVAEARIKAGAAVRAVAGFDFGEKL